MKIIDTNKKSKEENTFFKITNARGMMVFFDKKPDFSLDKLFYFKVEPMYGLFSKYQIINPIDHLLNIASKDPKYYTNILEIINKRANISLLTNINIDHNPYYVDDDENIYKNNFDLYLKLFEDVISSEYKENMIEVLKNRIDILFKGKEEYKFKCITNENIFYNDLFFKFDKNIKKRENLDLLSSLITYKEEEKEKVLLSIYSGTYLYNTLNKQELNNFRKYIENQKFFSFEKLKNPQFLSEEGSFIEYLSLKRHTEQLKVIRDNNKINQEFFLHEITLSLNNKNLPGNFEVFEIIELIKEQLLNNHKIDVFKEKYKKSYFEFLDTEINDKKSSKIKEYYKEIYSKLENETLRDNLSQINITEKLKKRL